MGIFMRFVRSIIAGIIFLFGAVSLAAAGIRIDSPKIRVSANPGSYASGEIKVDNTGQQEISIKVYLEDWVYAQADGSKDFMPKGTTSLSCSNWITFYPADFKLAAGKSETVHYTVNIPPDAKGGHFSVMFFETEGGEMEQKQEDGSTAFVKVLNRIGALFYAEAEGTVEKKAEIRSLDIRQQLNDFIVSAAFVNIGNTDITASGTFDVLDNSGFVYVRGSFGDTFTLPGDKAELTSTASSVNLKQGVYDILITLDFQNGGSLVQEASFTIDAQGNASGITLKS
ncbi:hypothetical protein BU251_05120 [Candidatus Velamenicoccus archaeovorus]|uniref:Uncharacterized protein n=2 Tax=Velamenicoccus archaeovorus TaxID=1930593 RepID=A0A410P4V5_VELA1|nr:hypothetical protein BU251_05120 [Candidatus Velamenicoccus archaeovorus]